MQVLLAQLCPAPGDNDANAARAAELIAEHPDADLAVFPELYLSGYNLRQVHDAALDTDAPALDVVRRAAASAGTAVVVGFAERGGDELYNSAALIDESGRLAGVYRKVALFGREAEFFAPGDRLVVVQLAGLRFQPAIRTLPPYGRDPIHIVALKKSIETALHDLDFEPDALIASFHGMPERTRALGDPYYDQCLETAQLLSGLLGRDLTVTFQSRFGRAKWLEPATDTMLAKLPGEGKKKVAIFAPGFSADCLETLEELAIRGRETFMSAGGTDFAYLPCLNDGDYGVMMLRALIARELEGWAGAQ